MVLLHLIGSVALLIWGVRLVRTGATRAAGPQLRSLIAASTRHRISAFASGAGATLVTQSSSATALIVGSFAAGGLISLPMALAVMLGADLGSALAAGLLSLDIRWIWAVLMATGVLTFMNSESLFWRGVGRAVIGLGMMLLALKEIAAAASALKSSPVLASVLASLGGEPLIALVVAALMAWALHSTLATVLIAASLAATGLVSPALALVLVLGANIGGAAVPVIAFLGGAAAARRMALANLLFRVVPALAFVPLARALAARAVDAGVTPAVMVVTAHIGLNVLIAAIGLVLIGPMASLVTRLAGEKAAADDAGAPAHLDPGVVDTPSEALACAMRETLRMGEAVTAMIRQALEAIEGDDIQKVTATERSDIVVDRLYEAIKLYLVSVSKAEMNDEESRRFVEILTFVTNLEHVGDIVDKNLMELAAKKIRNGVSFSAEGLKELRDFHAHVVDTARLAFNVFATRDVALARRLFADKTTTREAERRATDSHFARLREGRPESIETSAIHLDIIRDLKRIHGHFTSVAYPILETAGELASTRLVGKGAEVSASV